jgi:hypothetical protein
MGNFRSIFFSIFIDIKDGSTLEKTFIDFELHFQTKKKYFLQTFCHFWGFLKFSCLVAKSETGAEFLWFFDTYVKPGYALI